MPSEGARSPRRVGDLRQTGPMGHLHDDVIRTVSDKDVDRKSVV